MNQEYIDGGEVINRAFTDAEPLESKYKGSVKGAQFSLEAVGEISKRNDLPPNILDVAMRINQSSIQILMDRGVLGAQATRSLENGNLELDRDPAWAQQGGLPEGFKNCSIMLLDDEGAPKEGFQFYADEKGLSELKKIFAEAENTKE